TFGKANATVTNSGTIALNSGQTLTVGGTLNQLAGSISGPVAVTGALTYGGGTFNAAPLVKGTLSLETTAAAAFTVQGGTTLVGNLGQNQSLLVQGSST